MQEHVTEKLSAYLHHELAKDERQQIAEHLLQCENCRNEHDEIKLSATHLAGNLKRVDAPESVWNEIENVLNGEKAKPVAAGSYFSIFNSRGLALASAALLIAFGLFAAVYLGFIKNNSPEIVEHKPPIVENPKIETQPPVSNNEANGNQNPSVQTPEIADSSSQIQTPSVVDSNKIAVPKTVPAQPLVKPSKSNETVAAQNNRPSWNVETISGAPKAGDETIAENGKLSVGEFLETDANSKARVQVADIGQVEIQPNSRVKFGKTSATEHRLSLERGTLQAKILAPPRLFIVDTPSAVAVDLGCEYTLEVDAEGNSKLHVTSGYVALETGGRESIVPAGAICYTRKGKGLGTPFSEDA